jgi:hypothetical protein
VGESGRNPLGHSVMRRYRGLAAAMQVRATGRKWLMLVRYARVLAMAPKGAR